jgi:acetyl-CoA synthetase
MCIAVLNVSGHRLGTAEVESALVLHPSVVEAAVVGVPHDIKGWSDAFLQFESFHRVGSIDSSNEALVYRCRRCSIFITGEDIYAFVTLLAGLEPSDDLRAALKVHVRKEIGPIATPGTIQWALALPKTRSGKIMRRILRLIARKGTAISADDLGDTSTLADESVVKQLIESYGS